ncbi:MULTISPECIES: hypothetical protein [Paraburkholderia]|nr:MULTISPECIES: hypothetical protein [Paraburkholderia]
MAPDVAIHTIAANGEFSQRFLNQRIDNDLLFEALHSGNQLMLLF